MPIDRITEKTPSWVRLIEFVVLSFLGGFGLGIVACIARAVQHPYALAGLLFCGSVLGLIHGPFIWLLLHRKSSLQAVSCVFGMAFVPVGIVMGYRIQWPFLLVFPVAALWLGIFVARKWIRDLPQPGHCMKCGYNLMGNVSGICSECGTSIPDEGETTHPSEH